MKPKEHPILFSTPMVQAIMEGRKLQTRRIIKAPKNFIGTWADQDIRFVKYRVLFPYGRVGDVLWVRETWKPKYVTGMLEEFKLQYPNNYPWFYKADGETEIGYGAWKPSIHMPRAACRILLEITNIRVERLHDLNERDSLFEGVEVIRHSSKTQPAGHAACYIDYCDNNNAWTSPRDSFMSLWQSINGEESWNSNPFVWVIEFKKLTP